MQAIRKKECSVCTCTCAQKGSRSVVCSWSLVPPYVDFWYKKAGVVGPCQSICRMRFILSEINFLDTPLLILHISIALGRDPRVSGRKCYSASRQRMISH